MSFDVVPLITAFTFILLSEFGDKTQLVVMTLSSRSSAISVFSGAMLAFFIVDGLSILIAGDLMRFLPYKLVSFVSGLLFISFGIFTLINRKERVNVERQKLTFFKTASLISIMELGDKTQIASIILAAELKSPIFVLLGIMLAFSIVTGVGAIFGVKLLKLLPERYLIIGTSVLFLSFGIMFIINVVL